ncbi:MAG: hypothetical protein UZ01_00344 [Candidatus Brocadia sinica]|nr:MAG: hypothetical protein UZ01_00344 [Candidatus Brocadia sinica]
MLKRMVFLMVLSIFMVMGISSVGWCKSQLPQTLYNPDTGNDEPVIDISTEIMDSMTVEEKAELKRLDETKTKKRRRIKRFQLKVCRCLWGWARYNL